MDTNGLILGDTYETLRAFPSELIDLSITSPPYNKQEKNKGWLVDRVKYVGATDAKPEEVYQDEQVAVLDETYRATKPGGSFFYNHKIRWERGQMYHPMDWLRRTEWTVKQEIVWDRVIAANIRGWRFWQTEERIYWLYKPIDNNLIGPELNAADAKLTSVWRHVPESDNPHPAPFPLWLPARIIIALLRDAEMPGLVFDPYVGSGTTAVAAALLGHHYLGIDSSPDYLDMAEQRLKNMDSERQKIADELSLHVVKDTFRNRKSNGSHVGRFRKSPDYPADETVEQIRMLRERLAREQQYQPR